MCAALTDPEHMHTSGLNVSLSNSTRRRMQLACRKTRAQGVQLCRAATGRRTDKQSCTRIHVPEYICLQSGIPHARKQSLISGQRENRRKSSFGTTDMVRREAQAIQCHWCCSPCAPTS